MSDAELLNEKITRHYSRRDLGPLILEALARAGKDIDNLMPEELRHHLQASGFTITGWEDTAEAAKVWFARLAGNIREKGLPLLGIHLLLGDEFRAMARNQRVNLEEGRVVLAQVVARRQ